MLYPLHLEIEGMVCVIVGGGAVAVRKAAGLVACGACITVIAPTVSTRLVEMEACGKVNILRRGYRQGDFSNIKPRLVFLAAATSVNAQAREEARALGIFANDAASDDGGDFVVPSRIRRGSLLRPVEQSRHSRAFFAVHWKMSFPHPLPLGWSVSRYCGRTSKRQCRRKRKPPFGRRR